MEDPFSILIHSVLLAGGPVVSNLAIVVGCVALLLLLLLSAIISGSEVALFSLSESEVSDIATLKSKKSKRVIALYAERRKSLITILILNTVVNVSAITLATFLTIQISAKFGWSETMVVLIEMVVLTFLLLVVSEISPKIAASRNAKAYSLAASGLLSFGQSFFGPVSGPLSKVLGRLDHDVNKDKSKISSDDVKIMADLGEASGSLEESERDLIHSVIDLGEKTVVEVMTSRVDVTGIPHDSSVKSAIEIITESGHSRLPLYHENLDHVKGIIYAKDLLPYIKANGKGKKIEVSSLARTPLFVPESKKLDDLLTAFQTQRTHIAVVVDEYGGTEGVVTMEDVLEEIIGDIAEKQTLSGPSEFVKYAIGHYDFDASIDLDDVLELINGDLADDEHLSIDTESFDFETLGGLVFHLTEDIPNEGDEVEYDSLKLKIKEVDKNRIRTVTLFVDDKKGNKV